MNLVQGYFDTPPYIICMTLNYRKKCCVVMSQPFHIFGEHLVLEVPNVLATIFQWVVRKT